MEKDIKLSEVIKELEDNGVIEDYHVHREYYNDEVRDKLVLKIQFDSKIFNKEIKTIETFAF